MNLAAQPESFKRSIEELNLSGNFNITDLGLSKLLPELKRLRVLKLEVIFSWLFPFFRVFFFNRLYLRH